VLRFRGILTLGCGPAAPRTAALTTRRVPTQAQGATG
jgi:hypothetical protein